MAVGKTRNGNSAAPKFYVGTAACKVLAINPTIKEVETIMGYTPKQEPSYVSSREIDGKTVKSARVTMIVKTVPELNMGIDITAYLTFFIEDRPIIGSTSGKIFVMDNYVRSAWCTPEELKEHKQVMYKNGPAHIDAKTMHKVRSGEAELTKFVQNFLSVTKIERWDKEQHTFVIDKSVNPEDCVCTLDNVAAYFNGDVSEVKELIGLQPDNNVRLLFGVRYDSEGRMHQEVFQYAFARGNESSDYNFIQGMKENENRLSGRVYEVCPLKEYIVEASTVEPTDEAEGGNTDTSSEDDLPFPPSSSAAEDWED